jgi:hypothetical protein
MIGYLLSNLYTAFHELENNFGYEFTHFVNKLTKIANGLTIFGNDLNLFLIECIYRKSADEKYLSIDF